MSRAGRGHGHTEAGKGFSQLAATLGTGLGDIRLSANQDFHTPTAFTAFIFVYWHDVPLNKKGRPLSAAALS